MVSIIGAGPAGNYAAYQLARAGEKVDVYEEHDIIGKPIQCTGIITSYLGDIIPVEGWENYIVNKITSTRVIGPLDTSVTIKLKKNYIVDRALFDQHLSHLAEQEGATYHHKHRFTGCSFEKKGISLAFANGKSAVDTHLIGSDGPGSLVAKHIGIYGQRRFVIGVQARIHLPQPIDPETVDFYIDKNTDGYIGWVVPENERFARIGVASYDHAHQHFQDLIKKTGGTVLEWQSGTIPLYNPCLETGTSVHGHHAYLVGDAATMVKATTYGGIIPGMLAADQLASTILDGGNHLEYEARWRKTIGKELWLHLMIRRFMDRFTLTDYHAMLSYVKQEKILSLISTYDREYPSKLLLKMLFKEPRFLRFAF